MKTRLFFLITILSASLAHGQLLTRIQNPEIINQKDVSSGCGWIDYNGDQKPDPYYNHFAINAFFYENLGESNFLLINNRLPAVPQTSLSGISWGDINNDGLNDLFVCSMGSTNTLLKNKGGGNFEKITNTPISKDYGNFIQSSFVDYDNDGWLDLFAPTVTSLDFVLSKGTLNYLYHNDGEGNLTSAINSGLTTDYTNSTCTAFADYDNDGDQDVFLTDFFRDNHFYENNGNGTFTKIENSEITKNDKMSVSCSWADYDNDGNTDLLVLNGDTKPGKIPNYLFHNNGDKTFTKAEAGDLTKYLGISWSSAWGDLDNDGDLDLYLGTIFEDDIIFLNNGDGTFKSYTDFERSVNSTGVSMGDYNNDGFLDVTIARADPQSHVIFRNNGNENNWINLTLKGTVSNASAIGAKIKVKATIAGKSFWQYRELNGNQGLRAFNDLRTHFGLGDAQNIDSLVVIWPSKQKTIIKDVKTNQFMTIEEPIPAKYICPAFSADTLSGRVNLTVKFKDESIADANFPIKSWSWDFNNDGVEDANIPNPEYTFHSGKGEIFTVSLTISNGEASKTKLKKDFIQLFPLYTENLTLRGKNITASSSDSNNNLLPRNAKDGNISTRWSSELNRNPQWFKVELDSLYVLGKITIKWERAYAREFEIQTSTDDVNWKTVFTDLKGNGGTDLIQFNPDSARFVKLNLKKNASTLGFSFNELEIYRTDGTIITSTNHLSIGENDFNIYPNPVKDKLTICLNLNKPSKLKISVYDLQGRIIQEIARGNYREGAQQFSWDTSAENKKASKGVYLCRVEVSTSEGTKVSNRKIVVN